MATEVLMPQVGQDIETAVLLTWHKQVNDVRHRGDAIATVESDKASFDVEAFDAGVLLTQLYEEGQEVKVLTPIACLGEAGETIPQEQIRTGAETTSSAPASTIGDKPRHRVRVIASPSAKRLAQGQCSPRPAVVNGGLCIRDLMTATLACDHRAVDGAVAARFLESLKRNLEDPNLFTSP